MEHIFSITDHYSNILRVFFIIMAIICICMKTWSLNPIIWHVLVHVWKYKRMKSINSIYFNVIIDFLKCSFFYHFHKILKLNNNNFIHTNIESQKIYFEFASFWLFDDFVYLAVWPAFQFIPSLTLCKMLQICDYCRYLLLLKQGWLPDCEI